MYLVCECGHPKTDHTEAAVDFDERCGGDVTIENTKNGKQIDTVCRCSGYRFWYDDDESAETTLD